MYSIIRTIIFIIILIIFLVIYKRKKTTMKRNTTIIFVIIWGVILSLSYFLPVENIFYVFREPEDVFKYKCRGEITDIMEGNHSAMILYRDRNENLFEMIPRNKEGWKIGTYFSYKKVLSTQCDLTIVTIYNCKNSNDYYIIIMDLFVHQSENQSIITDNINTEFNNFSKNIQNTDMKDIIYYGYTNQFTEDYKLTINGKTYEFFYN